MLHPDYHHRNRWTRRILALLVLALVLWASHLEYEAEATEAPDKNPNVTVMCVEDDPCWDCETMGNRICGPLPVQAEPEYTG